MSIQEFPPPRIMIGNTILREIPYKPPRREFEYLDNNGKLWIINKSSMEPTFSQEPPVVDLALESVLTELSNRQHPISTDPIQRPHSLTQRFLLDHWGDIRDAIRPSEKKNKKMPYAFTEVDFGNYGRADFIGIASDGSLVVVEVGKSQKVTQVGRHALGLSRITNANIPIFPYTAKYQTQGNTHTLTVNLGHGATTKLK